MLLTVRNEGSNQAGGSSEDVGGGEGKTTADAINWEKDKKGSRKLGQAREEEVDVDVSSCYPHPHDEALIYHSTGEPVVETRRFNIS